MSLKSKIPKSLVVYHSADKVDQLKEIPNNLGFLPNCRALLVGRCNSGKTSVAINIALQAVREGHPYEHITVIHELGNLSNEYELLGDATILEEMPRSLTELYGGEEDEEPPIPKGRKLVIIEDIDAKALDKYQTKFLDRLYGCYSSHLNIDVIYTVQQMFSATPAIRRMMNYLFLWKVNNTDDLQQSARRAGIPVQLLRHMFDRFRDPLHDFIVIAFDSTTRLRLNLFTPVIM